MASESEKRVRLFWEIVRDKKALEEYKS